MPTNKLSKIPKVLSSSKEKEAEAEAERSKSTSSTESPPPGYTEDYDPDHALDPPNLTAGFSSLRIGSANTEIPQVDQTIAHLKVLECFYRLRQKIGSFDGLFGIEDKIILGQGLPESDKTPAVLAKLSEKRWAVYVSRAVDRFEAWSASISPVGQMLRQSDLEVSGKHGTLCDPSGVKMLHFDRSNMPPADVLMVWHAYMLNPRAYLEDCLRLGRMRLWHTRMPWQAAVDCIDSETFAYEAGEEAGKNFTRLTGLPWDNLDDQKPKQLPCIRCGANIYTPYTTSPSFMSPGNRNWNEMSEAVDSMLSSGNGYCDPRFKVSCPSCKTEINHDRLRTTKFCDDIKLLLSYEVPMGGTVLGNEGIPVKYDNCRDSAWLIDAPLLPGKMLRVGLGRSILRRDNLCMLDIRDQINMFLADRRSVRKLKSGRLVRAERIAIRRMMSRYWENSSPFALDLVGAVIRQGSFIEKMHNIDWLHSPALPNTMKRLITKYQRFVHIIKDTSHMAVPTLDVDLAWHTHQLSPFTYLKYSVQVTRQFIDHDDKVAETALNDAFAWTSKTYQKQFGEPYSECTCWYCEAIKESIVSPVSRLFNTTNSQASEQTLLHDPDDQDPRKSVHISAHNAVSPDDRAYQAKAKARAAQLEKQYEKACERARKKGRKPPRRDAYYYSDAWGYPVYMPVYAYGYYPFVPIYYPVNPACMAVTAGAAGNCCSGTCGGGVAAGACGSAGAGGCGGGGAGGAGGCAGGAAGVGGCGGGGGGGGGCGGGGGG